MPEKPDSEKEEPISEERALEVLRDARDTLKEDPPGNLEAGREVYERYQPHFRPGQVETISKEVIASFLDFENNRHWSSLHRQKSKLTGDMESLREGLSALVDKDRPLAGRFTEATEEVEGMGKAIATAVLHVAYPDRYGVWNNTSQKQMERLGLLPELGGKTVGEKYSEINDVLRLLSEELSLDLWTLDILWSRLRGTEINTENGVSTETASSSGSNSGPDQDLSAALEEILHSFLDARNSSEHVDSSLPVYDTFRETGRLLEDSSLLDGYPDVEVDWSVGAGNWAPVPWVAFLDERETTTVQHGTYVVYLFREDMSGVYATYNQGISQLSKDHYGKTVGESIVQTRAERLRRRSSGLEGRGFTLDTDIDLATESSLGKGYEKSTVAYKLYEKGEVPPDGELFADLEALLQNYDRHLSRREQIQAPQVDRKRLDAAVENLIRPAIEDRGDLEEDGRESHYHNQIIPEATPKLTPNSLAETPREAVLSALGVVSGHLRDAQREATEEFLQQARPERIQEEVSCLLYGSENLTSRVQRFLEWGSEHKTEDGRTAKLGATTASYLLCLSDPQEYAFCKPRGAYQPAAQALLGEDEVLSDGPKRIAHARAFYREVLSIFEEEHPDLPFFDLMHVHIAFYIADNTGSEEWGEGNIESEEASERKPGETGSDGDPNVYKVATGEDGKHWDDFMREGHFRVGWDEVGNLRRYETEQDFKKAFYEEYLDSLYDGRKQKASEKAGELWTLMEMRPGDRIVANRGESKVLGVGTVTEKGYEWKPGFDDFCHAVHVDWEPGYEQQIESRVHWRLKTVKQLPSDFIEENLEDSPEPYTIGEAVEGLFYEQSAFKSWLGRLRQKRNLILQGPPGVGKTFVSKRLAYALMGERAEDRLEMIQLHQSYAYEDFIRGYRPTEDGNFQLKNGVFFQFCERAKEDPERDYVFIIDEINRGNLSKVFGEVMMLIEADKRGTGQAIQLSNRESEGDPYGNQFYVPENVYLLGMMNTADRSLAMVDYALRRRFAFVEMEPRFETDQFQSHVREQGASKDLVDKIVSHLQDLNESIAKDDSLGEGFRIGHSYFCPGEGETPDQGWYQEVISREIEPLLKEYWFDNQEEAESHIEDLEVSQ